jgi:single-strand DNA-binding protein
MKNLNNAVIVAALVRDSELRYTPQGKAVIMLQLGGDENVMVNGEFKTSAFYLKGEFIGKEAEKLAETLKAGSIVVTEGKMEYQEWENEMGEKRSRNLLRINAIHQLEDDNQRLVADRVGGYRLSNAENSIIISGNVTRDVSLRHTNAGTAVSSLSVAVNESYKGADGEWHDKVHYVDVTAWDLVAEKSMNITKGSAVLIKGKLALNSWTTPTGEKRSKLEIVASNIEPMVRKVKAKSEEPAFSSYDEEIEVPVAPPPAKRNTSRRATA